MVGAILETWLFPLTVFQFIGAKRRAEQNGQDLTDEWVRNTEYRAKKKLEDEERNNRVSYLEIISHFLTNLFIFSFSSDHFYYASND